jgi:hypothetical protein
MKLGRYLLVVGQVRSRKYPIAALEMQPSFLDTDPFGWIKFATRRK